MTQNTLSPQEESTEASSNQPASTPSETASSTSSKAAQLESDSQLESELNALAAEKGISPALSAEFMQATRHAQVEISTEKRAARERLISASVMIPQPIEAVWKVLTAYEQLSDFVPNLTSSKLLPNGDGRIRLEQIGAQCFLKFKFCARVVLDMTENFPHEVGFSMVEGDFKHFAGAWKLHPTEDPQVTRLSYNLSVKPPLAMPVALIEHHICHNLTANLLAIRDRTLAIAPQG